MSNPADFYCGVFGRWVLQRTVCLYAVGVLHRCYHFSGGGYRKGADGANTGCWMQSL